MWIWAMFLSRYRILVVGDLRQLLCFNSARFKAPPCFTKI
jgi:hypothetical protein